MGKYVRLFLETISRYGLTNRSDEIAANERFFQLGELGEDEAEFFLMQLEPWVRRQERKPNFLARAPTLDEVFPDGTGDLIRLGQLVERPEVPVGLRPSDPLHVLFAGTTRAGKTIGMRQLIRRVHEHNQIADERITVVVLDRKGHDFSDLRDELGDDWLLFDAHGAPLWGLNSPQGVPVNVWTNELVSTFCACSSLKFSGVTLAKVLLWLVAQMNPEPTDRLLWPDWQLILDVIRKLPRKKFCERGSYLDSLLQILEGAAQASGELFRTFNGLDIERDLVQCGKSAIISAPNISPLWLRQFGLYQLINQVMVGRSHRGARVNGTNLLFVIDEADPDVSQLAERAFADGFSPISRVLRQGREFGVGVCLGVGSLGPVARHVLNSACYHFIFKMQHDVCREEARRTLMLPPRAEAIVPKLYPGEGLARTPYWSDATLVQIDSCPPNRTVPQRFDILACIPSRKLEDMPDLLKAIGGHRAEHARSEKRRAQQEHAKLRDQARALLFRASQYAYWPVARLYDLMGESIPKATRLKIRKELQDAGYAEFETVKQGKKNQDLIELTDAAWQLLGDPPIKLEGRGSLAHRTYCHWISMVAEKHGHHAELEWVVAGHPVDVAVNRDGQWHVHELVVACDGNLGSHLQAIFSADSPVITCTIVGVTKKKVEELRKQVEELDMWPAIRDRVRFDVVVTFERALWNI